jgi:hypothetical protein
MPTPEDERGYELSDEMKSLIDAKRVRFFEEAQSPPANSRHYSNDDWRAAFEE